MAKAVTLKDKDGNELYPVTSPDLVFAQGGFCNFTHGLISNTITSSTMADKMSITLPAAGRYMIMSCLDTYNADGNFNGEVNTQLVCGSRTDYLTTFIPPLNWSSTSNSQVMLAIAESDNTVVKLQASVNWPGRGTCHIASSGSYLAYVRIG